jgi:hypothetical protein
LCYIRSINLAEVKVSTFLDTIKLRLAETQREHQEATAEFQRAQAKFQTIAQRLQSWQIAFQTETQREQAEAAHANQGTKQPETPPRPVQNATITIVAGNHDVNKTDLIRQCLRQHPAGMTGKELWDAVKIQISHRPYVYSVLKRLQDNEEVIVRRKKYRLVPKPGEDVDAHTVQ